MENQNIEDLVLLSECSEKAAIFTILLDFLKSSGTLLYTYKSKGAKAPQKDIDIFKEKLARLDAQVNDLLDA